MPPAAKVFLSIAALAGALAVMIGAFGAHASKTRLTPDMMAVYQTGVHYHFWHALALGLIGMLCYQMPASVPLRAAGWLMLLGILLFSGSLYSLALSGNRIWGAITPIGGLAWIFGWLSLALAISRA